ncbi:sensor histidine kinase [Paenibacillus rigui]|uniref:sensor histidine kinase n=1 Tax=Paenibacillus rigui TaxID=554312 RepID=UPI0011806595|nr:histidine kinase [Paenibacillus rigui]
MNTTIIKDFLLQLAFIAVLILSMQIFFAERSNGENNRRVKIILSVIFGVCILFCMSFPVYTNSDFHIDIRIVPLMLGTLYLGSRTGIILSAIIILYRLYLGGVAELLTTTLVLVCSMPVFLYALEYFDKGNKYKRIQISLLLTVCYCLIGMLTVFVLRGFTLQALQVQLLHFTISIAVVLFFTALNETIQDIIRKNRQLQSDVKEAEIAFLRSQIKPHFLYNALNSIAALCLDEPRKAKELTYDLSQYLRSGFNFKQLGSLTTIENELELVKAYINIEKARFGPRLGVEYDVEANMDILIPPLILQPLVENAIRHGLMSNLRGGTVKISVKQEEDAVIHITIEDNGCGMSERQRDEILKLNADKTGIGLWNISERIRLLYGNSIRIESAEGMGTKVIFDIPAQTVRQIGG